MAGRAHPMDSRFISLDRRDRASCDLVEPDRYRQLEESLGSGPVIARGSGLSYVGASFAEGGRSVGMRHFDRILAFSQEAGEIEVEAGATLGKVFSFLAERGLGLKVQPGYPQITIGGCVAGNVHGKNQYREGTFKSQVLALRLFHPDHGEMVVVPGDEVFELTVGGLGLTGIILSARLAVAPLPGGAMDVEHRAVGSLQEAVDEIERVKDHADMVYGWNDLSVPGRAQAAPGYLVMGRYASVSERAVLGSGRGLGPNCRKLRPVVFHDRLLPVINEVYRRIGLRRSHRRQPLGEYLFPALGKEFYFDWFGEGGFIEVQTLISGDAVKTWMDEALAAVGRAGKPVALTTVKRFGGCRSLLNFDGDGWVISFDVRDDADGFALCGLLDDINSRLGCLGNILKDSRLSAAVVRRQYGSGYDAFAEHLRSFDPGRRFVSQISRRLEL